MEKIEALARQMRDEMYTFALDYTEVPYVTFRVEINELRTQYEMYSDFPSPKIVSAFTLGECFDKFKAYVSGDESFTKKYKSHEK